MRSVINISLPTRLAQDVKREVKIGGFATVSEYFRHLLREQKIQKLAHEIKTDRSQFERGRGKILGSLRDLR